MKFAGSSATSAIDQLVASLEVETSQRAACPECSGERSKRTDKDLAIHRKERGWTYHCHHCHIGGFVFFPSTHIRPIKRQEQNVIPLRTFQQTQLEPQHFAFLKARGISEQTALDMKLFAANKYFNRLQKQTDAIGFPYFKNGQYINAKYRSIESKDFTQDTGGTHVFFAIDKVDPTKPMIIVEGEIDALTLIECGIENVVSVPSGAPIKVSTCRRISQTHRQRQMSHRQIRLQRFKRSIPCRGGDKGQRNN